MTDPEKILMYEEVGARADEYGLEISTVKSSTPEDEFGYFLVEGATVNKEFRTIQELYAWVMGYGAALNHCDWASSETIGG